MKNIRWAKPSPFYLAGLSIGLAAAVFILDLATPLGVADGILYIAVVLIGYWVPWRYFLIQMAALTSLMTAIGFFASSTVDIPAWMGVLNRALILFSIWTTVLLTAAIRKKDQKLASTDEQLMLLTRAIEQSPVSIVITDTQGSIEYVNPKFSQSSGYAYEEVIGKKTDILKSLETRPDEYRSLWKTVSAGGEWRGLFHNRKKTGDYYWESVAVSPVKNRADEITHYLSVKQDITEQLETEKQLAHALKLEATGQLTSGIAHDFNNLLTIIIGNMQLIRDDDALEQAELKSILNDALSAANDGAELVNRLLILSRKSKPAASHVQVNAMLENLRNMLTRLPDRNIEVAVSLDRAVNSAFVDPFQLESAILNMAVNARDAMPAGGTLRLESSLVTVNPAQAGMKALNPGDYIAIMVIDNGTGMDAEVLAHALEPFYTTKAEGKGSGLGLSMAHNFARRSGGDMYIESNPNAGTTVTLYLPASSAQAREEIKSKAIQENLPRGGETILVVEDNDNVRRFAVRSLRNLGYRVLEADNSDAATELISRGDTVIDLLFSDIVIPGKNNGCSLAAWAVARDPRCRILLATGIGSGILKAQIDLDEDFVILRKPYTKEKLAFAVRGQLDSVRDADATMNFQI